MVDGIFAVAILIELPGSVATKKDGEEGTEAVAGDLPGLEISYIFSVAILRIDDVVIGRANEGLGEDDDEVPASIDEPGLQVAEVSGKQPLMYCFDPP